MIIQFSFNQIKTKNIFNSYLINEYLQIYILFLIILLLPKIFIFINIFEYMILFIKVYIIFYSFI